MDKATTQRFTFGARKDFWLGGYQAILRRDGIEIWRSNMSFQNRTAALRGARFKLSVLYSR